MIGNPKESITTCFPHPHFIEKLFLSICLNFYYTIELNIFVHVFICISSCYISLLYFIIVVIYVFSSFYIEIHALSKVLQHASPPPPPVYSFSLIYDLFCHTDIILLVYLFFFVVWFQANFPIVASHAYTIY